MKKALIAALAFAVAALVAPVHARAANLNTVAAAASLETGHFAHEFIITYDQFAALTAAEQMNYVKEMRKVMTDLSKHSAVFAFAKPAMSSKRSPANDAGQAVDPEDAENVMTLYKAWRERGKAGDTVDAVEQSAWYLATAKQLASRLEDPSRKYLFDESILLEQADVAARAKKLARGASPADVQRLKDVEALQAKTKTQDAAAIRDIAIPYSKLMKPDGGRLIANVEAPQGDNLVPPADIPNQPPAAAEKRPDGTFYRCLYAGFVIKHDPCAPPSTLPEGFGLADVDPAAYTCAAGETLCNPFLYGVKSDCKADPVKSDEDNRTCLAKSKGLCIRNLGGTSASAECARQAGEDSLRSAVALIRLNAVSFVKFRQGFHELCDARLVQMNGLSYWKNGSPRELPEKAKKDLDVTCGTARTQMKKLAEKYGVSFEPMLRRDGSGDGSSKSGTK